MINPVTNKPISMKFNPVNSISMKSLLRTPCSDHGLRYHEARRCELILTESMFKGLKLLLLKPASFMLVPKWPLQ